MSCHQVRSLTPPRFDLPFCAFLTYCPRPESDEGRKAKRFVESLKRNQVTRAGEPAAGVVARRLREQNELVFRPFFSDGITLIPVPRSQLRAKDALWPSLEIAESLKGQGLAGSVLPYLTRARPVRKAALSPSSERTKAEEHFQSLELKDAWLLPDRIVLVDDVVTRGAQLFGAAWRVWQERPDIEIVGFAVVRTISEPSSFVDIRDPCTGHIRWQAGECFRRP